MRYFLRVLFLSVRVRRGGGEVHGIGGATLSAAFFAPRANPKKRFYFSGKKGKADQSVKLRIGQIVRMGSDNLSENVEKPPNDIRKFPKTYNPGKRQNRRSNIRAFRISVKA
jgi:hypothetical protein